MWLCFSKAGDPDLDSLLDDLRKVKEEAAAATAVHDPRRPTVIAKENRRLSEKEFDGYMRYLQQSDVIHVPTSMTIYDSAKLCKRKSLTPEDDDNPENIYKHGRASFFQHGGHLNLPRPSYVTSPRSASHVRAL